MDELKMNNKIQSYNHAPKGKQLFFKILNLNKSKKKIKEENK